ncbi:sensor histidine kinase [Streptomyces sp. NPDC060030]|uniref:sensor histidine kinase n=1 Tax=Streptomyces sp. NPDC060030 TaxID=3347042 RepID=UPI0036B52E56
MRRPAPRTLQGQLTAGLVTLLALACLAVGSATALALRGFLIGRLDEQLAASGGRFAASLEHEADPDADNRSDTRGQAEDTFGARLLDDVVTQAAVVDDATDRPLVLTAGDRRALARIPVDEDGHSIHLSTSPGRYRMMAVRGDDRDILITGLPLHPVEETVHRLLVLEAALFGAALVTTGIAGALWVRVSLRPLRLVAAQATEVADLPLASGEVAMPGPLPHADPRTEVGRVGQAVNHMLGHVEDALVRRQAGEERLRHFAADASHELRTPVANIRGHAELALRHQGPVPSEIRHALERVDVESRRMTRLVDDLLLLARLDAGRPLEHEAVDLTLLILDATDDARAAGPRHHWFLDLPEEPVTVRGDAHRLQQAIGNLLANARNHTPPGTDVAITLTSDGTRACVDVSDNGPGIPEELQAEVFGRFVRGDHARSRNTGSTGLGLAIVQAVVTAHGGTVAVTSTPRHTTFRVSLPVRGVSHG